MNEPEWMPIYPCVDCETNYKNRPCQPPDMVITQKSCLEWTQYQSGLEWQKKLLGYQIAICSEGDTSSQGNGEATIGTRGLKSMLKRLEAVK